jgi:hypothetical protein
MDGISYQIDENIPHPVTLSVAKGLSSSTLRCFAEPVLSGAEGLSMTCGIFTLNWYHPLSCADARQTAACIGVHRRFHISGVEKRRTCFHTAPQHASHRPIAVISTHQSIDLVIARHIVFIQR